jgi:hypothetical protein
MNSRSLNFPYPMISFSVAYDLIEVIFKVYETIEV